MPDIKIKRYADKENLKKLVKYSKDTFANKNEINEKFYTKEQIDKLTINGTAFNGAANITTANWGTARNISITDGTNTSTAVSVNGSANVSLNLPATIKANLTGNCSGSSGSCTGNSASANIATKATQDAAGNTITTTYATKAENNTKANNSEVVHKSGDETIAGTKTFSNGVLSTAVNAFMAQYGGYTLVLRNDGSATYLLISDKDGVPGTWSSARPFVISNSTGVCDINGNAATATKATQDSDGNKITTTYSKNGHTHDDRYYTEAEVNNLLAGKANSSHTHPYIPTSASCNKNWNWSGQGGQPTWLWGGEDGTNMYVYNPANFSVSYANSAGYTNWLRTSSHSDHLFHTEWDGAGYFWTYVTAGNGDYRAVRVARSDSSGYADTAANGVDSQDANWIRFKNGVQICWGYASDSGFAFPKPFTAAPAVSLIHQTFANRKILINVSAMDSRNCHYNAYDVESRTYIDASVSYTAFGYWAG